MTQVELTILGIMAEGENHAYNIEKIIEQRGLRKRLSIGFSTIYTALKKLEKEYLLESRFDTQQNLHGKRTFSVTSLGKRTFTQELMKALSVPKHAESAFEIALCFAHLFSRAELKESLSLYDAELSRQIQIKVRELTDCNLNETVKRGLLTRPLMLIQAERKWIREFMGLL
ncbi:MAG: PadR family transcriptional regulator [archaeon]